MLAAAHIDCCVLANNHILDWGRAGLLDTLTTLKRLGIKSAGAGRTLEEARAAATLPISGKGRVLVFSFAAVTSGTPRNWAATSVLPASTFSLICLMRPSTALPIGSFAIASPATSLLSQSIGDRTGATKFPMRKDALPMH